MPSYFVRPFDLKAAAAIPQEQCPMEVLDKINYKNKILKGDNKPSGRPMDEIPILWAWAPKHTRKWIGKCKRPLSPPSPTSDNSCLFKSKLKKEAH